MPRLRIQTWQFLVFIALSGYFFGQSHFGGVMQNPIVDLSAAIVESGKLTIDEYQVNSPDVSFREGHYYSGMAPSMSILGVPVYVVARTTISLMPMQLRDWLERKATATAKSMKKQLTPHYLELSLTHVFMSLIFGGGVGALGFWLVRSLAYHLTRSRTVATRIGLVFIYATIMVYYTAGYFTQSTATCMLLLSIYLLFLRQPSSTNTFLGAFCGGTAGVTDYPFVLYGGIVILYAFLSRGHFKAPVSHTLCLLTGFAVPILLAMIYHDHCFGSPWTTAYSYRTNKWHSMSNLVGIGLPTWERLEAFLISPREGLLTLFPISILAPCGFWYLYRQREQDRSHRMLLLLMGSLVGACALYYICVPWSSTMGGYGHRFFICGIPFVTILSYPFARRAKAAFVVLVTYSVVVNHLNLIGVFPLQALEDHLAGEPGVLGPVRILEPLIRINWVSGLAIYLGWLVLLSLMVFVVPEVLRQWRGQSRNQ